MPTREQAGVYTSVLHYIKAAGKAKTDDAAIVNTEMRKLPVDKFGRQVQHPGKRPLSSTISVFIV